MSTISVIIPTLNEADQIQSLLSYLSRLDEGLEIIVADGGSSDDTVLKARQVATVIQSPKGRGVQMNAGARIASGNILWFLHADCRPHPDSISKMRQALMNPTTIGGGYEYNLDRNGLHFWLAVTLSNFKNHLFKLLFGDMGIFVRRNVFQQIGGYPEIPIMEDMEFCKRLKKAGKIVILPQRIETSARRWLEEGFVKNSLRSWILQSAWALGVSPRSLAKWYRFK